MAKDGKHKIDDRDLIRHKLFNEKQSSLRRYTELTIGGGSLWKLLRYEALTTFLGPIPGAFGLFVRRLLYPCLLKHIGKGVVFGRSVTLRHPDRIRLGNRVVIDDYALIDARGAGEEGIVIADDVIIGRGTTVRAKVGTIQVGSQTNVGEGSTIVAQGGILIGEMVTIAGHCHISGGAYQIERDGFSEREHEKYTKGPIRIDRKCRLGMGVIVLDGVHIHEGCIVGASSLVTKDLPEYCVAAGSPAVVKRGREHIVPETMDNTADLNER